MHYVTPTLKQIFDLNKIPKMLHIEDNFHDVQTKTVPNHCTKLTLPALQCNTLQCITMNCDLKQFFAMQCIGPAWMENKQDIDNNRY